MIFKNYLSKIFRTSNYNFARKDYLRLDANERNYEFSKSEIKNFKKVINSDIIQSYPNYCDDIVKKISKLENIKMESIALTQGIDGALKIIFESIANIEKKKLHTIYPTYGMIDVYSKIYNFKLIKYRNKNDFLKKNNQGNIIYIANPNSPSGEYIFNNEIKKIISYNSNNLVIIDEAYIDFTEQNSCSKLIPQYKNLIVLKSFSKGYGLAGLRAGYIMTNKNNFKYLMKTKSIFEISGPTLSIVNYLLEKPKFKANYLSTIKKSKKYFEKECKKRNLKYVTTYANFVYLLVDHKSIDKIFFLLKKNKILVKTNILGNFKVKKNHLRITLSNIKNMQFFFKTFDKIIN